MPEVHNPNLQSQGSGGGGGDMRSTMAFMLIVLAAFLGYQYFFQKPKPQEPSPAVTQTQPTAPASPQSVSAPAPKAATKAAPAKTAGAQISASAITTTTVENELYKIQFTNQGAQVQHWILKKYLDSKGKPLDLVQPQAAARFGQPLSLFTYDSALTSQLNQALYQVTVSGAQPTATGSLVAPATITFHYAADGLDAVKTFSFNSTYVISVDVQVKQNGTPVRALVSWPAGLGDMQELQQTGMLPSQTRTPSFFAWSIDGKQDSEAAAKVSGDNTVSAPYQYAAVMDLYFASAFLPDVPDRTTVVTLHNAIEIPSDATDPNSKKIQIDVLGLAMGDTSGDTRLRLFAGPKATDVLKSIHATGADGKPDGPNLEPLIQYGWMTVVAKPLYLLLRFMVEHGIGNWGWAIILSTVIFNLTLLPTRLMMTKSSLKMMRIQPKVDAIKKRYANLKMSDPKRGDMNAEMMALYKAENINMYGNCLPMLVPMLLLWPYFRVLEYTVELRQAHWLWLPDLSQPDPTHILPIFIIISMFLTQYMTPSPGMDPSQRRMMAFMMPVLFGFMLWHYASGLALYWGTGNLMMMAMQIGINRSHWGKEMHEIASRRAAKKAGANPKTIQGKR
ncbi:MAG TPA: membrane protein insertase YidC [Terracidiphilus sp.]|nr:membrane protein insertase YidC [Terracidiphilus sp.]